MNTIKGTVYDVQTQSGTSQKGEWTRTTVVVLTPSQHSNLVPISFFNYEGAVKKGDKVEIEYYAGGREYQGKYYAQLDGKTLTVDAGAPQAPQTEEEPLPIVPEGGESSDLPF